MDLDLQDGETLSLIKGNKIYPGSDGVEEYMSPTSEKFLVKSFKTRQDFISTMFMESFVLPRDKLMDCSKLPCKVMFQKDKIIWRYIGTDLTEVHYTEEQIIDFLKKIIPQLLRLHHLGLFHGDLKLANIISDGDDYFLIDFTTNFQYKETIISSTDLYYPPEYRVFKLFKLDKLKNMNYYYYYSQFFDFTKFDSFSLGIIILRLLKYVKKSFLVEERMSDYINPETFDYTDTHQTKLSNLTADFSIEMQELIFSLLNSHPDQRLSIPDLAKKFSVYTELSFTSPLTGKVAPKIPDDIFDNFKGETQYFYTTWLSLYYNLVRDNPRENVKDLALFSVVISLSIYDSKKEIEFSEDKFTRLLGNTKWYNYVLNDINFSHSFSQNYLKFSEILQSNGSSEFMRFVQKF